MWYFILALLFGNPSTSSTNDNETSTAAQASVDNEGNTELVRSGQ